MVKHLFYLLIALLLVVIFGSLGLLIGTIKETKTEIYHRLIAHKEQYLLKKALLVADLYRHQIQKNHQNLQDYLAASPLQREVCNHYLSLMRDETTPYVYLLFLDHGKFRYLCDGSKEKGRFFQKFDINEIAQWKAIYHAGRIAIIDQSKYNGLWKSMLYPLVDNNQTVGMLVIDYATTFPEQIHHLIEPLERHLLFVIVAIGLLSLLVLIQSGATYFFRRRSFIDPLTQIYNRRYLPNFFAHRNIQHYALAMIDIDHFKRINDLYGHLVGDHVLQHITQQIRNILPKRALLIRFGGEEFLVVCPYGLYESMQQCAQMIRRHIEKTPFVSPHNGLKLHVTVSIGLHDKTQKEMSLDKAIQHADIALYGAKNSGRNYVKVVSKEHLEQQNSAFDFDFIKRLIDKENVICHYQPIVANQSKTIIKYETLVRLKQKDGTLLMPHQFLPVIWGTNSYIALSQQIIDQTITKLTTTPYHFSINFSIQDLFDTKILHLLQEAARRSPKVIERLGIEVLEYDSFDEMERLQEVIDRLKSLGFRIILDDFGSGHANFAILEKLAFDEIKIDGSIIRSINESQKAYTLIEALARFGQQNHIQTTAEFVSDHAIYEALTKLPIDYLQGFFLGKPAPLLD